LPTFVVADFFAVESEDLVLEDSVEGDPLDVSDDAAGDSFLLSPAEGLSGVESPVEAASPSDLLVDEEPFRLSVL
jgi:hypothetical protein